MSSVRQRFTDISQNVRNRVRSIFRHDEDNITDQLVASTNSDVDRNQGTGYTELMGGSVPCPSCNGSGMIPKELEGTLVALIPLTDDRLKPKKLWKTVIVWITIFILLGSATIFVLMPRTVNISSLQRPISIVHIIKTDPQDHQLMEFDFFESSECVLRQLPPCKHSECDGYNRVQVPTMVGGCDWPWI
ncbi:unnamed protein product [Bursaphelenchus okinawaensis]|uniref:Transmembrane protein 106 N-terminal domain-containing protein n=1 Tax=Bursaphelenchus okinawaensis TaxID=465554 RepID=A0A811JSL7_9BILA|nr:unnamed protein product [Bursaphelenchus okinawaensis]CAG9081148.1 unnamed protein product [Bursaphelenchus okinawaensis]